MNKSFRFNDFKYEWVRPAGKMTLKNVLVECYTKVFSLVK